MTFRGLPGQPVPPRRTGSARASARALAFVVALALLLFSAVDALDDLAGAVHLMA